MKGSVYKFETVTHRTFFHRDHSPLEMGDEVDHDFHHFKEERVSTSEIDLVENFANPLCTVVRTKHLIVVEKKEHKVSIKYFRSIKLRKRGVSYFKFTKNVDYISVNTLTGDFYSGYLHNYQKKKKFSKSIRKNFFVNAPIHDFKIKIRNGLPFDNDQTTQIANEALKHFFQLLGFQNGQKVSLNQTIIKFYLDKKGVKYPDNFVVFFGKWGQFPTLKKLRKYDMKLVDTVMAVYGLQGDVIKKAFHSVKNSLNLELLPEILQTFPNSWVLQDPKFVETCLSNSSINISIKRMKNFITSKSELRNFFECYKNMLSSEINNSSFADHCQMYIYLKNAGEQIKWKSKNNSDFQKEHLDWTNIYDFYKRGSYKRIYPQELFDCINSPLVLKDIPYFPVVLDNSSDYNNESIIQSNCVKTYIGRPGSIIVSLRRGTEESDDRATIEYHIAKIENEIVYHRPQSLGKFNSPLSDDWKEVLEILDQRMEKFLNKTSDNFQTVKLEKILTDNRKLFSDSEWSSDGYLSWTYNIMDNLERPYFF